MRHIDDSKDENILRSREFLKKLKERSISSYSDIRDSKKINIDELMPIVSKYSNLLYHNGVDESTLDSDRAYRIAENLYFECRKITDKKTKEEFDIAVKLARLKTAQDNEREFLMNYIEEKIKEYDINEDSPVWESYNSLLSKQEKAREEQERQEQGSQEKAQSFQIADQEKEDVFKNKYRKAKENASEKGEFWPELVEYVYPTLKSAGFLEGSLNAEFPKKIDKGYETNINYIFLKNSFKDTIVEKTDKEHTPNLMRLIRENALETGRENLEKILETDVVLSGDSLSILLR